MLDHAIYGSFQRLLTDTLAFGINSGGIFRSGGGLSPRTGFDQTSLSLKHLVYKDELHETLGSASLTWGIGGSGSQAVRGQPEHARACTQFWERPRRLA